MYYRRWPMGFVTKIPGVTWNVSCTMSTNTSAVMQILLTCDFSSKGINCGPTPLENLSPKSWRSAHHVVQLLRRSRGREYWCRLCQPLWMKPAVLANFIQIRSDSSTVWTGKRTNLWYLSGSWRRWKNPSFDLRLVAWYNSGFEHQF